METPCILLIDDHAILRDALKMLLQSRMTKAQIFAAALMSEALNISMSPDVVVLDLNLPDTHGLDGLNLVRSKWPQAQVLVLSAIDDPNTQKQALSQGASLFISKVEDSTHIVNQLYSLLYNEMPSESYAFLTPRQYEVLELLSQGLSNKLIARKMKISDNTVRRHVQDLFAFLHVSSRTEAVFEARRKGLIR